MAYLIYLTRLGGGALEYKCIIMYGKYKLIQRRQDGKSIKETKVNQEYKRKGCR